LPYIQGGFIAAPVLVTTVSATLRRFRKKPKVNEFVAYNDGEQIRAARVLKVNDDRTVDLEIPTKENDG